MDTQRVVVVSLRIRGDRIDQFLSLVARQTAITLDSEPGCLRFEVLRVDENPNHFILYEVYAGPEAWAVHRLTPHFAAWRAGIVECLEPNGQQNLYCTPVPPSAP